jgi:tetratricopeptide (TPR) repeat protein
MRRITLLLLAFIALPAFSQSGFNPLPLEQAPALPAPIQAKVVAIKSGADKLAAQKQYSEAIREYWRAYDLLPQPGQNWQETAILLVAIGEANFSVGNYEACRDNISLAMQSPGAFGNPIVHLRLGACQYELGNVSRAADELARAYIPEGKSIFQARDQKYLAFVKTQLDPPPGGWPNGW